VAKSASNWYWRIQGCRGGGMSPNVKQKWLSSLVLPSPSCLFARHVHVQHFRSILIHNIHLSIFICSITNHTTQQREKQWNRTDKANSSYSGPKKWKNKNEKNSYNNCVLASKTDNLHNKFACIYIVSYKYNVWTNTKKHAIQYSDVFHIGQVIAMWLVWNQC